jgi:serine/threonine protein kinase
MRVVYQVALALADLHTDGYIHRDLKPENILLDPSTCNTFRKAVTVKLVDFGMCRKHIEG